MSAGSHVLVVENLTKRFGAMTAVDNVSLSVEQGSIVSLLGPSGCGKTTLLRMIAGFEVPTVGDVFLSGQDMRGKRPYERNVGLLFQDYALFPHMTVEKNIAYGLHYRGVEKTEIPQRTREMLELVRLEGFAARRPQNLSGGQQQRVALARALASRPDIVLLDEPLSALDAKLRLELRTELRRILKRAGTTAVVVTHDQEEALSLGERVIVMESGQIRQQGSPADIYDSPQTRFVAEFVGRSNWFTGTLGKRHAGNMRELVCNDVGSLIVPDPAGQDAHAYHACVRPHRIVLHRAPFRDSDPALNTLDGTVADVGYFGGELEILVTLRSGMLISATEKNLGQSVPSRGQPVKIAFRPLDVVLIPE